MQKSFYENPRPCYIYLLVLDMEDEEPYFYVGKTFSNAISKVYSKHIHAGFATTKNTFSNDSRPNLYILRDYQLTGAEAYRYVVAYTRFFEENKLGECLNHDGTMRQADFMKPETLRIYQEISQEPLEALLRRTCVARAVDVDRKRASAETWEVRRGVQLNIGVNEGDKVVFDNYCKRLGVSRRDGFGMLLDAVTNKNTAHYESVISSKEKKIEKQAQEIKRLQLKLALATGEALPKKELWASAIFPFLIAGIKQYLQLLFPQRTIIQPVKSRPYKGFMRGLLPEEECIYPEEEGFYVIKLQAVLWGNRKSCFYAGVGVDGKNYKFRYYAKEWFTGIAPRGSTSRGNTFRNCIWQADSKARTGSYQPDCRCCCECAMNTTKKM